MDTLIRFECPACGRKVKTKLINIGKKATCACGHQMLVPDQACSNIKVVNETAAQVENTHGEKRSREFVANDRRLSLAALEAIDSKPSGWEYRLFAQVIIDECRVLASKPKPYFLHDLEIINQFNLLEFHPWMQERFQEFTQIIEECVNLVNMDDANAFGPPGTSGNAENIVATARRVVDCYHRAIEWTVLLESNAVGPKCHEIAQEYLFMGFGFIWGIEQFAEELLARASSPTPTSGSIPFCKSVLWESYRLQEAWKGFIDFVKQIDREMTNWLNMPESDRSALLSTDITEPSQGYIYLLVNPSMKGLIKIGHTQRSPQERVNELGAVTGVPTPFLLVFDVAVNDSFKAESYVHDKLDNLGYRVSQNREFFTASPTEAIKIMLDAQRVFSINER